MNSTPTNTPDTFGAPANTGGAMSVLNLLETAPPRREGPRPAVRRALSGDGANLIVFTFAPGQSLPDHQAAYPITVMCLTGHLVFTCEGETVDLAPGVVCHLAAHVPHRVDCPPTSEGDAVLLLTMLTGTPAPHSPSAQTR